MSTRSDLEQALGHVFGDGALLDMALTHASVQEGGNYERLEFLGDRVLGLVAAHMLYESFPGESEGEMALRHTALVQKAALVRVAAAAGIAPFIRLSSGEGRAGGSKKDTILSDAVEALIGAVYLDAGFAAAETLVRRFWTPLLVDAPAPPQDPKTALQEWAQGRGLPVPVYKLLSKSGPEHAPVFEIEAEVPTLGAAVATAASKRAAEKEAAILLLARTEKT